MNVDSVSEGDGSGGQPVSPFAPTSGRTFATMNSTLRAGTLFSAARFEWRARSGPEPVARQAQLGHINYPAHGTRPGPDSSGAMCFSRPSRSGQWAQSLK